MELGIKVKELRIERGLTQMRLAQKAEVGLALISALETGRRRYVTTEQVEALATALGVDSDELWGSVPPRNGATSRYIPLATA